MFLARRKNRNPHMGFPILIPRLATYFKRHGFRATARRVSLALRRVLFSNRQVVFYCDLANHASPQEALPNSLRVERKKSYVELSAPDLHEMVSFWNPTLAQRNIEERLGKGSSLWLIKSGERLAGYGWTLQGRTIAPYYFPLGESDVQFFDFHVFPKFRGRAMDWLLMTHIFQALAAEGAVRAFAEAGEWNRASLSSLTMACFHRLGYVRNLTLFRRTIVWWSESEKLNEERKDERSLSVAASAHEKLTISNNRG